MVIAAAVLDHERLVGPEAAPLGQLNDSKKLAVDVRDRLYDIVMRSVTSWSVIVVSPARIDRVGLHRCNLAGMRRALEQMRAPFGIALVDGFQLDDTPWPAKRLIKGDATSASIAAASIIAKVTRDRLMARIDEQTGRRWAFAEHMGYATPLHHDRIRTHGISALHRLSFASQAYEHAGMGSEGVADVVDAVDAPVIASMDEADVKAIPAHGTLRS